MLIYPFKVAIEKTLKLWKQHNFCAVRCVTLIWEFPHYGTISWLINANAVMFYVLYH